jgi:hypothetical protein
MSAPSPPNHRPNPLFSPIMSNNRAKCPFQPVFGLLTGEKRLESPKTSYSRATRGVRILYESGVILYKPTSACCKRSQLACVPVLARLARKQACPSCSGTCELPSSSHDAEIIAPIQEYFAKTPLKPACSRPTAVFARLISSFLINIYGLIEASPGCWHAACTVISLVL